MKIALISYEFPSETGGGGIGTFLCQYLPYLNSYLELAVVICGTLKEESFWETEHVYRLACNGPHDFSNKLLAHFKKIHDKHSFDLVEGTDYLAWGLEIKRAYPKLPLVVRLHTPLYLIDSLQFKPLTGLSKLRFSIGSLLRLRWPQIPQPPSALSYQREFDILNEADFIISPSQSIYDYLVRIGMLNHKSYQIIPFGFSFSEQILNITARLDISDGHHVIFIGRLEKRKGVLELAKAIPEILLAYPLTHFTFVGGAAASPQSNLDMMEYLQLKLKKHVDNVKFVGRVHAEAIPKYLEMGDIFVFPSEYESFGIACCEAMAASKAVLGSVNGGMAEIIDHLNSGILISSNKKEIMAQLSLLIENNQLRISLGENARIKMLAVHGMESIIAKTIATYVKVINEKSFD